MKAKINIDTVIERLSQACKQAEEQGAKDLHCRLSMTLKSFIDRKTRYGKETK